MSQPQQRIARFSLLATSFCFVGWIGLANANEETPLPLDKQSSEQIEAPELVPPSNSALSERLPSPQNPLGETAPLPPQQSVEQDSKKSFLRPAQPPRRVPATTALSVTAEPMPAPDPEVLAEVPEFEVHPAPPIEYDTDHDARKMYRKSGEVQVVMIAKNPVDGCYYEIPMCIPACCVGEPQVTGGRGLLGRGIVEFCWQCGFRAKVKFRHVLGDVKVDYKGD